MRHETAFHWIQVHVLQFLDYFLLTPHIEVVEPALPKLWYGMVGSRGAETDCRDGRSPARVATQLPRDPLLQDLQYRRRRTCFRLTDEKVDVFRHDCIPHQREAVAISNFAENLHEEVSRASGTQQRQAPVTTARDEVQVALSVPPFQSFGHGEHPQKPRP